MTTSTGGAASAPVPAGDGAAPAPQRRPRGITIVAVALTLLGVGAVLFGGLAVAAGAMAGGENGLPGDKVAIVEAIGIVYLLIGASQVFVAWALWRLKRWAWWLTVVLQSVAILQAMAAMAFTEVTQVDVGIFIGLVSNLVIVGYFLTKGVRRAFGYGAVFGQ